MIHVGMDVHKQFSQVEVMDDKGRVLDRRKLLHLDKEAMSDYFRELPSPATVTLEATRNWYWLYELIEEYCDVKLAHPQKVKLIAEAKVKTDKIDAHVLAQLGRLKGTVLFISSATNLSSFRPYHLLNFGGNIGKPTPMFLLTARLQAYKMPYMPRIARVVAPCLPHNVTQRRQSKTGALFR